jgi:hypothetical protein
MTRKAIIFLSMLAMLVPFVFTTQAFAAGPSQVPFNTPTTA